MRIGRILQDPAHYSNRGVTVEGRVTNVVGALVAGVYQIDDGTGRFTFYPAVACRTGALL